MIITIIGCGVMGGGFARRLSATQTLFFYDRNIQKAEQLEIEGHGKVCRDLSKAIEQSDMVILAVKPQGFKEAAGLFNQEPPSEQILVSILSGISLADLRKSFSHNRIVRLMPNLALICGEGLIALSVDSPLNRKENEKLEKICNPLGKVYRLDEDQINAFTALAGSGPAFIYALIESMTEAGILMGFNAEKSLEIVKQMIKGSVQLLESTGKHPAELKWQISSPKGTTIAGLRSFEESGVPAGMINTFFSAYERANELSDLNT